MLGRLSLNAIMNDEVAKLLNEYEFSHGIQRVSSVEDLQGRKLHEAKSLLKSVINVSELNRMKLHRYISYNLGTYFADKYSTDIEMQEKMFELINNPNYSFDNILNELDEQSKHSMEK